MLGRWRRCGSAVLRRCGVVLRSRGRRRDTLSLTLSKEGRDGLRVPSRAARRAVKPADVGDEVRQATQVQLVVTAGPIEKRLRSACLRGHVTQAHGAGIGRGPIWRGGRLRTQQPGRRSGCWAGFTCGARGRAVSHATVDTCGPWGAGGGSAGRRGKPAGTQ